MIVSALDVGGTHVSGACVDMRTGDVLAWRRLAFAPEAGRDALLSRMRTVARAVALPGVACAGVGVPGPFDYEGGVCTIRGVEKLEALYGTDLRGELAPALGLPPASVRFLNDAEAFLIGEAWTGAAREHGRALGITLGTGLGSAFLVDGRVVREGPGVPTDGSLHHLSFRGDPVEARISRRGLLARYEAGAGLDVRDMAMRARRGGDPDAEASWRQLGEELAEFLAPTVAAFRPDCVVVGGSIARAWDLFGQPLQMTFGDGLVSPAANIERAPLLGAARYAAANDARRA